MSVNRVNITKSTEAMVRVPALIAAFPRLQDLITANIPSLQDLVGLTLVPDRYEDGRNDSAKVDDFCLYRGEQFVARFRYYQSELKYGGMVSPQKYAAVCWQNDFGRLLQAVYDYRSQKLPLTKIWIGQLGEEAIITEGKVSRPAPSSHPLSITERLLNSAREGTALTPEIAFGEYLDLILPKPLKDSLTAAVGKGQNTLRLEGQLPFFHQPFSLALPLSL